MLFWRLRNLKGLEGYYEHLPSLIRKKKTITIFPNLKSASFLKRKEYPNLQANCTLRLSYIIIKRISNSNHSVNKSTVTKKFENIDTKYLIKKENSVKNVQYK